MRRVVRIKMAKSQSRVSPPCSASASVPQSTACHRRSPRNECHPPPIIAVFEMQLAGGADDRDGRPRRPKVFHANQNKYPKLKLGVPVDPALCARRDPPAHHAREWSFTTAHILPEESSCRLANRAYLPSKKPASQSPTPASRPRPLDIPTTQSPPSRATKSDCYLPRKNRFPQQQGKWERSEVIPIK